jgi:hypothetical protein
MTSKLRALFIGVLALIGLAGMQPAQAQVQPAPQLCGFAPVNTNYVLPQNCEGACKWRGHTAAQCAKLVPRCRSCWSMLQVCTKNRTIPAAQRCKVCTDRYATCMKPFFL